MYQVNFYEMVAGTYKKECGFCLSLSHDDACAMASRWNDGKARVSEVVRL